MIIRKDSAQNSLADFAGLSQSQRDELSANPDKWIDENFPECLGETRALLNGNAEKSMYRAMWQVPLFAAFIIASFYAFPHHIQVLFPVNLVIGIVLCVLSAFRR